MTHFAVAAPIADRIEAFKANCAVMGCKARTKKLSGSLRNAVRVVIVDGSWDELRDAAVLTGLVTSTLRPFTHPQVRSCFDGSSVNVFFPA
jgi:hypothetical protein